MDLHHDTEHFHDAVRHDGWSPRLKARFLSLLAEEGNVRRSARRCGRSAQSAYVQRRRDPVFAQAWAGALVLALDHGEQVLGEFAVEGIEEAVFHRGEQVGTRRRFDTRLLLAHLARLDRAAGNGNAQEAAGRFDEMLALIAGEEPPEALSADDDLLPPGRTAYVERAAQTAERRANAELPYAARKAAQAERQEAVTAAGDAAFTAAAEEWDGWFEGACALVDGLDEGEGVRGEDEPPMEFKSLAVPFPSSLSRYREGGNPSPDRSTGCEGAGWLPAFAGMTKRDGSDRTTALNPVNYVNFGPLHLDPRLTSRVLSIKGPR